MTESSPSLGSRRSFLASALAAGAAAPLLSGAPAAAATAAPTTVPAQPRTGLPTAGARDEARWQTCLGVARQLLLVGPKDEDLKLAYLRTLIDEGLPKTTRPKNVLVIGAGISGIVSALLLKGAGHNVTVLEANGNRIGGRIKTFRRGPESARAPFSDPELHAEAGAMRIPDTHVLTLALMDKLKLKRQPFYDVDIVPGTGHPDAPPPAVSYTAFTGETWTNGPGGTGYTAPDKASNTWIWANGVRARYAEYAADPRAVNRGFGMSPDVLDETTHNQLTAILAPVYDYYSVQSGSGRKNMPFEQWVQGWAQLIYDFDGYSMGRFLTEHAQLTDGTLEGIGTIENETSRLPLGFIHSFLDFSDIAPGTSYWELTGGTATLPYALAPGVADVLKMNRRVVELEYYDPTQDCKDCTHVGANGPKVWVRTVRESGSEDVPGAEVPGSSEEFTADVAIVTVPFSSLRHVQISPLMSYRKRRAVIELHYDAATKVLLEFNRRWWEFTEDDWKRELDAIRPGLYDQYQAAGGPPAANVVGGGSVTDNPNRFIYHPSHQIGESRGGVVLAAYTWADDAVRWDSLEEQERYSYALRGMQEVYGRRIEAFYTGHGKTQSWVRNRYACGEAAILAPDQLTQLHPAIGTPEGPLHFAGEHTSLKHAWIEGALESAVRTALEVNAL
ncbi:FAD-dependent oxidoreductase [Catenulispora sp. NF23]|uniref:flavin monoamine oxidase family protein n=1 Tax=Catenulispora pinistramenti TaxID=2705254 RepID=UPI001BA9CB5A|nr:FAD-dependent oxidoreductase [Catenulispora pinistramenti]MBS2535458.1 FAD-dependent oxidoreductase [Catenulispora pinistramenti]